MPNLRKRVALALLLIGAFVLVSTLRTGATAPATAPGQRAQYPVGTCISDPETVKYLAPDGSLSDSKLDNALEVHIFSMPGGESNVFAAPADWRPEDASPRDRELVGYPERPTDTSPANMAAYSAEAARWKPTKVSSQCRMIGVSSGGI